MTSGTITTVEHVAHARLLIAPTAATSHMTTADSYYCGACGTCVGATSVHCSDGPFDISESLLLPSTMATGRLILAGRCYYGARGTRMVPTSRNSSDGPSDISRPLLLPSTVATG
jgi:hypothetical protein